MSRVYNFSAGPAVLPEEVLKEAQEEMLDYRGCGMSVMEMSHRSKVFQNIIDEAEADLRDLMGIPSNYKVLFLQGGASLQFSMIPMNLMKNGVADYIVTGQWAKKAYAEAQKYGKANKIASSEDKTFSYIPDCSDLPNSPDADYVYIDFLSFVDIVDAVGGIDLDISDEEAEGMKPPMAEQNKLLGNKKGTDYLDKGGKKLHVNGNQALAYARLRYVGNADFQRTERQRTVITKIIEKAKGSDPLTIDKFAKASMSHLTTNMSQTQLFALTYKAIFSMNYEIKSMRIPDDDSYSYGTSSDGQSILEVDFEACKALLKKEIYNQ